MAREVLAGDGPRGNVVLDLDGCVYVGGHAIPGARDALETARAGGFRVLFATNNSTKTARAVADRLADITGFVTPPESVVTSAGAAAAMLDERDDPVLPIGEAGLVATLLETGRAVTEDPEQARSVVVGLDRAISYERIRRAATAVILGARFIGSNHDATFPTSGVPAPGAGSIVAAVARAAGVEPSYAGKPHAPMRDAITRQLGDGPTWMVGDRPDTDIACGRLAGWTTVLVQTGVAPDPATLQGDERPDHVLATIAELPALLGL